MSVPVDLDKLAGDHVRMRPAHAVLHRKAAARNDCRPLEK
jgi:hypothetical protein